MSRSDQLRPEYSRDSLQKPQSTSPMNAAPWRRSWAGSTGRWRCPSLPGTRIRTSGRIVAW